MRLDIYIKEHFNLQSRNKASELIKQKKVFVDGTSITKPSFVVVPDMEVTLQEEDFFVSRAAYKLEYFLQELNIELEDLEALDIGSSTGGFTQILLRHLVKSVTCVDVGSEQLHESIKSDRRVIVQENTDIRKFIPNKTFDIVTCDVSFISILTILEDINRLSKNKIIILFKPQFEVGKEVKRDRNGVVQDQQKIQSCKEKFLQHTQQYNWQLQYKSIAKLAGKNGNIEEVYYFIK